MDDVTGGNRLLLAVDGHHQAPLRIERCGHALQDPAGRQRHADRLSDRRASGGRRRMQPAPARVTRRDERGQQIIQRGEIRGQEPILVDLDVEGRE